MGLSWRRYSMTASRSARVMLFCINGQSRVGTAVGVSLLMMARLICHLVGARSTASHFSPWRSGTRWNASLPRSGTRWNASLPLLFVVVVAIFNDDSALAVFAMEGFFVSGENMFRLIQADDFDIAAHEAEGLGEIADVLELGMERPLGADAGADDDLGAVTAVGHEGEFVEVIDNLVDGQQQEVPARKNAQRHLAAQRETVAHAHLQLFAHGQFEQLLFGDLLEGIAHGGAGDGHGLAHEHHPRVGCEHRSEEH